MAQSSAVIVRAIVLGFVLLEIGSTVTLLPLLGNLRFHAEIPWAFPMTLVVLGLYAAYFSGWGPACRNPWSAAEVFVLFCALNADLAGGNSGDGIWNHRADRATIALSGCDAGPYAVDSDFVFIPCFADCYWRAASIVAIAGGDRGNGVPRIHAKTTRRSLWHCAGRADRRNNVLDRAS